MSTPKHNVLIAGIAGASLGTELAKCLKLTENYKVFGCDISKLAYGHFADEFDQTYTVNIESYIQDIVDICLENKINYIVPGGEKPTFLLSKAVNILKENNITFLGNNAELVAVLGDKKKTFELLKELGFEIPLTKEIKIESDLDEFTFPCIVKPATGTGGSESVFIAGNKKECLNYLNFLKIGGRTIIVQEYIPLTEGEFTIGILSLPNKKTISCVCMKRIFNSKLSIAQQNKHGLISSGYSQGLIENNPKLEKQAIKIAEYLQSQGPLNIQARVRNGNLIPFEINPRFSASTYLRAIAGVNEVEFLLDYLTNGTTKIKYSLIEGNYMRSFTESFIPKNYL